MEDNQAAPLPESRKLARQWLAGIRYVHIAHTQACADYQFWGRALGFAVAVVAAATGSTVFSAAGGSSSPTLLFVVGGFSLLAALLAAAQTALEYPARASKHAAAAIDYGQLRRDFEAALVEPSADLPALLARIRTRWSEIEAKYPFVSQARYDRARRQAGGLRQGPPAPGTETPGVPAVPAAPAVPAVPPAD